MIARTTTTGNLKGYRFNLQRSAFSMNKSQNTVLTARIFNSFAEDPATAAMSFQKRRALLRTNSQQKLNSSIQFKYQQAWKAMDQLDGNLDTVSENSTFKHLMLRGENGPDASARNALGQSMTAVAENMVQTMNGRYGENFIFGGADALNVPFTWGPKVNPEYVAPEQVDPELQETFQYLMDDGKGGVTGTNKAELALPELNPKFVDTSAPGYDPNDYPNYDPNDPAQTMPYLDEEGNPVAGVGDAAPRANPNYNEKAQFKYLTVDGEGTNDESAAVRTVYYRGVDVNATDEDSLKKLKYFSDSEVKYTDLGLGFELNGETIESSTVFDQCLQGVDFLGGYGLDEDGDPKNVIALVDRMGTILRNCSPDDGDFATSKEGEEFYRLAEKYEKISSQVKDEYVELDTRVTFLNTNATILETNQYNLQVQISGLEDVDEAMAISDFIFAKYSYDTALKVGNSVLGQSLMDYLNL